MRTLLLFLFTLIPIISHAFEAEVDGILYELSDRDGKRAIVIKNADKPYQGNVHIPASINYNNQTYPVEFIGEFAFEGCTELTSIHIPCSVTIIGYKTFSGCI